MMEKDSLRTNYSRERTDGNLLRSSLDPVKQSPSSSDFGLKWGTRKRLRCTKTQIKDVQSGPVNRTTVRVDRRVVRTDKDSSNQPTINNNNGNGYINLRQRPASPSAPPPHRVLRNSENSTAMRGQSNGVIKGCASLERGAHDKRGGVGGNRNNNNNHHHNNNNNDNNQYNNRNNKSATSSDSKKGGSSSGSGESIPLVWPSQFVLSLTNKEKEEDFMIIKGSKPSQRPKKRSKFIQRTLNLVSPGEWLCDLSLERYEVREKKISKKRPRGLKAMGNMESDSE